MTTLRQMIETGLRRADQVALHLADPPQGEAGLREMHRSIGSLAYIKSLLYLLKNDTFHHGGCSTCQMDPGDYVRLR